MDKVGRSQNNKNRTMLDT